MVFVDKKMVLQFPCEITATSRRAARHQLKKHLSFTTGSEAIGGKWIGRYREFYVQLYVRHQGKIIHSFAAQITAAKRREAKFDITKRLNYKTASIARKDRLIKHG